MGLLQPAYDLSEDDNVPSHDREELQRLISWFRKHLKKPARLRRSRRPHRPNKALSWFKPGAQEHISKAREIIAIIERNGVLIREISTDRPGYVVYEDEFQIVAEPFSDTPF